MNGKKWYQGWTCVLLAAILVMVNIPWNAMAAGETVYLKGVSTRKLAESGEIGLSISATNGVGEGISIKPSDLQVQVNGRQVEALVDHSSSTGHIFVVDYSMSPENKKWLYATEATASMITGIINMENLKDDVMVVWVGEVNQVETLAADDLEAAYRKKRDSVRRDAARLYDGIGQAIDLAEAGTGGYDYYNLYILTDGQDNGSSVTLDYLSKKVQDGNSPLSVFACCYYNGARTVEAKTDAETTRKALMQFAANLDGVSDSFDIQRVNAVGENVKHALGVFSNARYGQMNVLISLKGVPLDRTNGQTEIFVGLTSGGTAKKKTVYLPVDELPAQTEADDSQDYISLIAEKDAQIDTLVSGAALKDAEISALKKTIEEQKARLDPLEAELAEKSTAIETLKADAEEKADRITVLEDEKKKAESRIASLEKKTAEQAAKINTLEADNAKQAETIETQAADIEQKAAAIETLEADQAEKTQEIKNLKTDVSEKASTIKTLESDVADKASRIKNLETETAEKSKKIETLEADVAEKAEQITALAADLSTKITEIGTLQATVKEKDSEIESLMGTIAEKTSQIKTLEADVSEKETQIEKLSANNRAQAAQLQIFKQKILEEGIAAGYDGIKSLQVIVPTKDYIVGRLSMIPDIAAVDAVTVDNDPNGQLGKEGQYIEQIFFSSPLVDPKYADDLGYDVISAGTVCGGSIEVYRTIEDAMKRNEHLAYYDGSSSSSGSHIVVGTVVIRTSSELALVDQRKLESEIVDALISAD